jgi:hypothetical protein
MLLPCLLAVVEDLVALMGGDEHRRKGGSPFPYKPWYQPRASCNRPGQRYKEDPMALRFALREDSAVTVALGENAGTRV